MRALRIATLVVLALGFWFVLADPLGWFEPPPPRPAPNVGHWQD